MPIDLQFPVEKICMFHEEVKAEDRESEAQPKRCPRSSERMFVRVLLKPQQDGSMQYEAMPMWVCKRHARLFETMLQEEQAGRAAQLERHRARAKLILPPGMQ